MKVVFPFYSTLESGKSPMFIRMAETLQKTYGMEIVAVGFGVNSRNFIQEHKEVRFHAVYDLYEYMAAHLESSRNMPPEERAAMERKYGIPNLWLYAVGAEPQFDGMSPGDCIVDILTQLRFWEELFAKEKPDAYVDEGIGGWTLPVYRTAQAAGVRILNMMTSRMPDRFSIHYNPFDRWERSMQRYAELKGRALTPEEQQRADEFVSRFLSGAQRPPYMIVTGAKPTITMKAPLTLLNYFKGYRMAAKEPYHAGTERPLAFARRWLTRVYRHRMVTTLGKPWEDPVEGEPFFLFPHMYQPENSTKVFAPFYVNQVALIENIARSLPVGVKLYVKMHTADLGMRPLSYYREIKKFPNVRLINPYVDSYRLQKQSLGVLVITGTMGYEAILLRKPVVLFGRPYFDFYDHAIKVYDITQLPAVLLKLATEPPAPAADDEVRRFVLALLGGSTYPGEINFELPSAFSKENVDNLCGGLAAELGAKPLR